MVSPAGNVVDSSAVCQAWWSDMALQWASESWTEGRGSGAAGHKGTRTGTVQTVDAAICLSGQLRTFLQAYETMEENLLKIFDEVHVFAVVTDLEEAAVVRQRLNPKVVVVRDLPHHRMSENIPGAQGTIAETVGFEYALPGGQTRRVDPGDLHPQYFLKQLEGLSLCNELRHFYELHQGVTYRWVVRARWDTVLLKPLQRSQLREDAIIVPAHHSHGGINDKLAVGPPGLMETYFSQLDAVYLPEPIVKPFQAETFLRAHLAKHHVDVVEVSAPVYILRADGSLSQT
eukprot:CAMPEP_0118927136 /NCGR_PEP_ID=MMETSP1169-20130426/4676_1 /TAXON_ID=36882 /ORGANISM="Pyramimonas obovata, Strain CCMP722" /LENGTH=287 /DNA_ID=CAMNT_0006868839 /DNA_START=144 /DNA_END=1007 /DNA_ORIENTATION=-